MATESTGFGARILSLRRASGLSQEAFAKQFGKSTGWIQNLEGGGLPSGANLVEMAQKINCSLDWLLLGIGPMSRSELSKVDPDLERICSWLRTWWAGASERDRQRFDLCLENSWPDFAQWNRAHGVGTVKKD
jgi:transcriptional regulator with XRE-family HTH domain